jgi:hypothetical protein
MADLPRDEEGSYVPQIPARLCPRIKCCFILNMSRRKTFCEKYPELCERDTFTDYRPLGNLGLPVSRPPPRRTLLTFCSTS